MNSTLYSLAKILLHVQDNICSPYFYDIGNGLMVTLHSKFLNNYSNFLEYIFT